MEKQKLIQESDLEKAAPLDEKQTAYEALKTLGQAGVEFGVVYKASGKPKSLVSKEQLRRADGNELLNSFLPDPSGLIVVEFGETIDRVAQRYGKQLELWPNLAGVVVMERKELRGILLRQEIVSQLRQEIVSHASRVVVRGAGTSYLEGSPIDYVIYECPEDHERKIIDYYDPQNHPRCTRGHLMQIVE